MRVQKLPIEKIGNGLAYLKGTDPGRRRITLDLEEPVTVMEVSPGVFELVDGFKRIHAIRRRGEVSASALVREGDILKAKTLMLGLNARRKTLSFYEEAVLAADLHREEKLTLMAVGKALGRKKSWVSRRVGIVTRLDDDLIEFLKAGEIGPTAAYHLSRLQRELQMPLFLSAREEGLTAHEVEAAVSLTLALPEDERRAAVRDPRGHLSPPEEPPVARDSGIEAVERLIRDARRVRGQLAAPPQAERSDAEKRVRRGALRRLGHELSKLQQVLDEVQETERRNHERQGGPGKNCAGHEKGREIHSPDRTGSGHGEEARSANPPDSGGSIARFPGGTIATFPIGREALETGSLSEKDPGTCPAQGQDRQEGGPAFPETDIPNSPQGRLRGRQDHPRGVHTRDTGFGEDEEGLCPI